MDEKELLAPAQEETPIVAVSNPAVDEKELPIFVEDEVPALMESDAAPVVKEKELHVLGEEVATEEISAPMEKATAVPTTSPVEELPALIEESAAGKEEPTVVTEEIREAPSEEEKVADVVPDGEKAGAPSALDDEATQVSEEAVPVAEEKDVPTATEEEMAVPM